MIRSIFLSLTVIGVSAGNGFAQPARPTVPYPNESAWLQAENSRINRDRAQLKASQDKLENQAGDLVSKVKQWKSEEDANERFGQKRFSGEAHRRAHEYYVRTRDSLESQRKQLKQEAERLLAISKGLDRDRSALSERTRVYNDRLAAIGRNNGGTSTGGGLYFDDNAPKPKK